jgi:hypothetical protein
MDSEFVSGIDSIQLSVGSLSKFNEMIVQVSAQRLADANARQLKSQKHT